MCEAEPATGAVAQVEKLRTMLGAVEVDRLDDTERLALLRAGEDLTRRLAAVGVRTQVAFAESQVAEQAAAGVPVRKRGLAVADDIAAARKASPYLSSRELSSARALVAEMPRTLQALSDGTISAYQSRIITEATTCLSPADRAEVDERLAGTLAGASNAEIGKAVRGLVYELDPAGFVARARKAAKDRGVSVRPAPDVMAVLSARLTAPHAVACYKALRSHAVAARASGDPRSLNQLMADELVSRLTGRTVVDGIDVEVGLVMTDAALFDGASDPADLEGYGPIPAEMARDLLRPQTSELDAHDPVTEPGDGGPGTPTGSSTDSQDDDSAAPTLPGADGPAPDAGHAPPTGDDPQTDTDPQTGDDPQTATDPQTGTGPQAGTEPHDPTRASSNGGEEACPDGIRCSSWECSKVHGVAPSGAHPVQQDHRSRPAAGSSPSSPSSSSAQQPPADQDPPPAEDLDGVATAAKAWVRRLYADPATGVLTGRDPRRRVFTGSLRAFLIARDRTCRNSWCGAPIRDIDHIRRHSDGGATDADNGRGLCQRCNLARERERHHEPPPDSYRAPPPAVTTLVGRQLARAPAPQVTSSPDDPEPSQEAGREVA